MPIYQLTSDCTDAPATVQQWRFNSMVEALRPWTKDRPRKTLHPMAQTDKQTDRQTDIANLRLNWPSGHIQ